MIAQHSVIDENPAVNNGEGQNLTPRQLRLLTWISRGDLIYEVVNRNYWTIFDESKGRDHRVKNSEVEDLARLSLIRKVENPGNRLDSWDLTPSGHAAVEAALEKMASSKRSRRESA
jgi:RIO-like serine/threonine protein kinase